MRNWILIGMVVMLMASVAVWAEVAEQTGQQRFDKATIAAMSQSEIEQKATAMRIEKDYQAARVLLEEATRRQPKNATLFNKLGLVELQLKDIDTAISHFNRAVKLNPKFADALNNIGTAYFVRSNFDGAGRYYRKALALDETRAVFHANLAATWLSKNKLNLALTEYARALELDPDVLIHTSATGIAAQVSSPEERASRFFVLARVFAIRGDAEGALENLKKAKEEGYRDIRSVYKQQEFAKLWDDPRLTALIGPAKGK